MSFDLFIDRVLVHEGGYVNNPADPGGETQWGISKRSYPALDIRALTRDQAIEIYRRDFWDRVQGDALPPAIAYQALDFAVNSGVETAIRKLQVAAGVADDGHFGPLTTQVVNRSRTDLLLILYIAERIMFQVKLRGFDIFGRGWMTRNAQNLRLAVQDLKEGATLPPLPSLPPS